MNQSTLQRQGVGLRGIDRSLVSPGYVLFAHLTSPGVVRLIDINGKQVHKWTLPHRIGRHARIIADGVLAVNCVHPDSPTLFPLWQKYRGGLMLKLSPTSAILSSYSDPFAHHDQNHLSDGTIIYSALAPLSSVQASTILGGIPNSEAPGNIIYGDVIKHVDPRTGELLWEWKAIDNLDPEVYRLQNYAREHWPLVNSVERLSDGNVLASLRSVSAVIVIDYRTKEVLWHLDSSIVAQQHCATEILPASPLSSSSSPSYKILPDHQSVNGNTNITSNGTHTSNTDTTESSSSSSSILLFDNGVFRPNESFPYSRVLQISLSPSKRLLWSYQDPNPSLFFSPFMGSAQRLLPNTSSKDAEAREGGVNGIVRGNTLITQAHMGRIFEVTPSGKIVWEYVVDDFANYEGFEDGSKEALGEFFGYQANAVFRAYKYRPEEIPWLSDRE